MVGDIFFINLFQILFKNTKQYFFRYDLISLCRVENRDISFLTLDLMLPLLLIWIVYAQEP